MLHRVHVVFKPAMALLLSLVIAGCQTTSGGWGNQETDPRLTEERAEFFTTSGAQACALGAGLAMLACLMVRNEDRGPCLAIAAAAGCGIGASTNYVMDQRRAQYANHEQRMQAYISDVQADSRLLQQRMVTYRAVLSDNQREITRLQREVKTKTANQRTVQARVAEMKNNQQLMQDELANLDQKLELYRQVSFEERINDEGGRQFQSALSALENERDDLQALIEKTYQDLPSIVAAG